MEKQNSNLNNNVNKVKLLCSYGGKILARPTDHQLSYVGGDTKILAIDRNVKFSEIAAKLNSICHKNDNSEISVKYQLPGEDLDALVSVIDDDDVEHMMVENDRMQRMSTKPVRLRLFIFDVSGPPAPPPGKSDAKESIPPVSPSNPDYLFGFDKEYQPSIGPPLDLLQIPGVVPQENYGLFPCGGVEGKTGITEGHGANNVSVNGAAAQAIYRVPAVVDGRQYQTGPYVFGVVPAMASSSREQPVYNIVPVVPPVRERKTEFSTANSPEMKANQRSF